jgi:ADP-ribosylation factor protein 1
MIGFNAETIEFHGRHFVAWDVGGSENLIPLWQHYYQNTFAIFFVIDSTNRDRLPKAREELHKLMGHPELQDNIVLIVLANKQDAPMAMSVEEIKTLLAFDLITNTHKAIYGISVWTGAGIEEATTGFTKEVDVIFPMRRNILSNLYHLYQGRIY